MNIPSHLQEGEFFKGNVKYISMGPFDSKYSIVLNDATIKVKNAIHVRCVLNDYGVYPKPSELPDTFEIIAPIAAVTVVSGEIPSTHIHWLNTTEYLEKRNRYIG
jgi:hypothetical protein|tara:strand:- start:824 stop:1138 length:315 start_codon:yes stop_codon:yes gene_type:complete